MKVGKIGVPVSTKDDKGKEQKGMITVMYPVDFDNLVDGVEEGDKVLGRHTDGTPYILTPKLVVQALKEKITRDLGVNWRSQFKAKTVGGKVVKVETADI